MEKRLDEYLLKDEKVLWHGRAKENDFLSTKLLNVLPVMLLWLIAECVVLGVAIINKILGDFNTYYFILTVAAILLHLLPTSLWFVMVSKENARIASEQYVITNKRVLVLHSLKHDHIEWVDISAVSDVNIRRSFGEAVLGTGRIIIDADDDKIVFYSIEEIAKAFRKIYGLTVNGGENSGQNVDKEEKTPENTQKQTSEKSEDASAGNVASDRVTEKTDE